MCIGVCKITRIFKDIRHSICDKDISALSQYSSTSYNVTSVLENSERQTQPGIRGISTTGSSFHEWFVCL